MSHTEGEGLVLGRQAARVDCIPAPQGNALERFSVIDAGLGNGVHDLVILLLAQRGLPLSIQIVVGSCTHKAALRRRSYAEALDISTRNPFQHPLS